jgi:hypothetical protein
LSYQIGDTIHWKNPSGHYKWEQEGDGRIEDISQDGQRFTLRPFYKNRYGGHLHTVYLSQVKGYTAGVQQ